MMRCRHRNGRFGSRNPQWKFAANCYRQRSGFYNRVATNLENLEYSGISLRFLWTWKTQGLLREFCATSGKYCNKQCIFSSSFKHLCKVFVRPDILLELMWNDPWWRSLLRLLLCCDNLWKSKCMALEKPGKLREFFSPTLWPPCIDSL